MNPVELNAKYLSKSKPHEVKSMIGNLKVSLEDTGGEETIISGRNANKAFRTLKNKGDDVFRLNAKKDVPFTETYRGINFKNVNIQKVKKANFGIIPPESLNKDEHKYYMTFLSAKKPTKKRLKYLIKDEKKSSKEYRHYGFKGLSKDEKRHAKFLNKRLTAKVTSAQRSAYKFISSDIRRFYNRGYISERTKQADKQLLKKQPWKFRGKAIKVAYEQARDKGFKVSRR
jgi:hypothetical protein